MKIAVYMNNFIYKYGGTECYAANLIEILQNLYSHIQISIITELYHRKDIISVAEFCSAQNRAYGLEINPKNLEIMYIKRKNIDIDSHKNKIVRLASFVIRQESFYKTQKLINSITRNFDLFINCSRYSFYGCARKNLTIVHFPKERLSKIPINSKLPFLKTKAVRQDCSFAEKIDLFIPNSKFTSYWLTKMWNIPESKKKVLYPPVTPVTAISTKKENQIFICSRIEKTKKIDILINAFASSEILRNKCRLIIAGSIKGECFEYVESLKQIHNSVEFVFEPTREELEKIYSESSIFWHAKGINETNPLFFEHFGITTVEALSASCIPIVINKGGQKEIVDEFCGFRWNTTEELIKRTEEIVENPQLRDSLRKNCKKRSSIFTKDKFAENFYAIFNDVL